MFDKIDKFLVMRHGRNQDGINNVLNNILLLNITPLPLPTNSMFWFFFCCKMDVIFAMKTHFIVKTQVFSKFIINKFMRLVPSYPLPHTCCQVLLTLNKKFK